MTSIHNPGKEFTTGPGEPVFPSYGLVSFGAWFADVLALSETARTRPRVIAIDGRGGSGKTTLAERMACGCGEGDEGAKAVIIHTDDIAWNHSRFDWDTELAEHILKPLRAEQAVDYTPPGWAAHGREGSLTFDPATVIIVEGSGCIRPSLAPLYDATVYVQSDLEATRARGVQRDVEQGVNGGREEAEAFWDSWAAEELDFLEGTRPWEKADFVVVGHKYSELPETMVTLDKRGQYFLEQLGDDALVVATSVVEDIPEE